MTPADSPTRSPAHDSAIAARGASSLPDTPVGQFMFMPAGPQTIHATKGTPGGRSKDITAHLVIERGDENLLQRQLESINARGDKAYFDFNHEDRDASFWPARFTWQEAPRPGVYVSGEWSEAGRTAIAGKVYRAFSPVFHVDDDAKNPCRIICQPGARPNMGGLVNDPAFKNNLPLWAKHAGAPSTATKNPTSDKMKKTKAELEAEIQQINKDLNELQAREATPEIQEAIAAKQADLELASARLEAIQAREAQEETNLQLQAIRAQDAQKAVANAVARGAIGAKDEALKSHWIKKITDDPAEAHILAKMKGSVTLDRPIAASSALTPRPSAITISRESNASVLSAMGSLCARQGRDGGANYEQRRAIAREIAAIYGREILPRLRDGDDIPLAGAASNTLGTLAQTLVATRTLELLTLTFPFLGSIWTDFSDQIVSYGDAAKTRYIGIPSVKTFNTSTGWATPSDVTTTDVSITYNQFKGVPIQFLGHELAGTTRRLFDELAPAQAYALGKDMVDYMYALITSAYTNTVTAAGLGTFGRSTLIDIGGILDDAGVPEMSRFLLLNRPYYSALSKDNTIIQLAAFQRASIIERGLEPDTLQNVEGFRVIKAVNLPATVISGTTVLKGFAGSKSSLVLASRLSADYVNAIPGAANGNLTVVTTPAGFSANLVQFVDHVGATANSRLEVIYGGSRGQVAAGALLTDV